MIRATDIHSLTEFTRNAKSLVRKVKENRFAGLFNDILSALPGKK